MRTYRYNSEWMPKNFPHDFDAHIYFPIEKMDFITQLRQKIADEFRTDQIFVGDIIPEPIGPHVLPMLEVNFSEALFSKMIFWLSAHRAELSVLVHPQTGDDYYDHTQMAIWLGSPVEIKLSVFK